MGTTETDHTATLPRKRMAAAVLFADPAGRVLLVEPTYKDRWEFPGGSVDADESPYGAAVREIGEELGLSVTPGRLLVVDWVRADAGRTEGVMFVFDGGRLGSERTARIRLPPAELHSWAWCRPDEAAGLLPDRLARRLRACLSARADGTTHYLEDGVQVV
jgi:8-oxo-dGTP pyrophosphatase MutT (NUDIX family)